MTSWYLDASAIVKLSFAEAETRALRRWMASVADDVLVTSELSIAEVMRAAARAGAPADRALAVVDAFEHLVVDRTVLIEAERMSGADLRTLDAVHLASARVLGHELAGVVTYDRRLAAAAEAHSFTVVAPGAG